MSEHMGHRQRLYDRLKEGKIFEHELLEMLLFNAVPRQNTNALAHRLLAKFGTVKGIFQASLKDLEKVEGVGRSVAGYLHILGRMNERYCEELFMDLEEPSVFSHERFLAYVKRVYSRFFEESLDFYMLDSQGRVLGKRRFKGEEKSAELEPESFTNLLLAELPAGIIAVHNHPTGRAKPSEADDNFTAKCQVACSFHNVLFCDHIVYGSGEAYSYYLDGKLGNISKQCSLGEMLKTAGKVR